MIRPDVLASRSGRTCLALALVLTVTGCSDPATDASGAETDAGDAQPDASDSAPAPDASDPTAEGSGDLTTDAVTQTIPDALAGEVSGLVARVAVDEIVPYAGFDVEVVDVLLGFDPAGFRVAQVNVNLTNRSSTRGRLGTLVTVQSQGQESAVDRDATGDIDAGGTGSGYFSIRLFDSFATDDAILTIGREDRNRVVIPLGSAGELVTRRPVTSSDLGSAEDDVSSVAIDTATFSWDTAEPREQSMPGAGYLTLDWTLETTASTAVNDDVLVLRLPSGEEVAPVAAVIAQVEPGTVADLSASFTVPDPPAGDYVLVYTERFGRGSVEVPFTFALDG